MSQPAPARSYESPPAMAAAKRVDCTVNLRAPLLIDTGRRLGYQHVLPNDAYPMRHPLPRADAGHAG